MLILWAILGLAGLLRCSCRGLLGSNVLARSLASLLSLSDVLAAKAELYYRSVYLPGHKTHYHGEERDIPMQWAHGCKPSHLVRSWLHWSQARLILLLMGPAVPVEFFLPAIREPWRCFGCTGLALIIRELDSSACCERCCMG